MNGSKTITWGMILGLAMLAGSIVAAPPKAVSPELAAWQKFVKARAPIELKERAKKHTRPDKYVAKRLPLLRSGKLPPPILNDGLPQEKGTIGRLSYDSAQVVEVLGSQEIVLNAQTRPSIMNTELGGGGRNVLVGGDNFTFILRGVETKESSEGDTVILPDVVRYLGRDERKQIFERFDGERPSDVFRAY